MASEQKPVQIDPSADVTEIEVSRDFLKIATPARIMIAGPTLSGMDNSQVYNLV